MKKNLVLAGITVLIICNLGSPAMGQSAMQDAVGYDQVRSVIRKRCVTCHNPDEMRGDLDLSGFEVLMAGASSGPIVVAGKPNQSALYKTVAHLEDPVMPPNSPKIPGRELDLIRRWIEDGLVEKSGPRAATQPAVAAEMASKVGAAEQDLESSQPATATGGLKPVRPLVRTTAIIALDTHPTENIAAISGNQQAVLLDIDSGEWRGALDFPEGDVTAVRFSRDGRLLVVAGGVAGLSGLVVGFDVASGERVFELADENDTILSVDLSPDGSLVSLGGPAKVVRVYNVSSGEVMHTLRKHTDWVMAVRFSPDGLLLASGDRFGGLFVWDLDSGTDFHTLRAHVGAVNALAWDDGSETLISAGEDQHVRTWNMHYGELTDDWDAQVGAILSITNAGGQISCGGRDKKLSLWRGPNQRVGLIEGTDQFERVAFSADQKSLVGADAVGSVRTLDTDSFQVRSEISLPVDASEQQAVYDRLAKSEQSYAERPKLAEPLMPTPSIREPSQDSMPDVLLALRSQIETSQSQIESIRQNAMSLNQTAATTEKAILATAEALEQLRASQVELQSQIKHQEAALAGAQKHALELERIYEFLLNSTQLTSTDNETLRKQVIARLQKQRELLDTAMSLREQINADSGLQREQQIVEELTKQLQGRMEQAAAQLKQLEGDRHGLVTGSQP